MRDWLIHETYYGYTGDAISATSIQNMTEFEESRTCSMRWLPGEIGHLIKLETLVIVGQCLKEIPAEIGNLSSLRNLDLDYNELEFIPAEIGLLKGLKRLSLEENPLAILPKEIVKLQQLDELNLLDMPNLKLTDSQKEWVANLRARGCDVKCDKDLEGASPEMFSS